LDDLARASANGEKRSGKLIAATVAGLKSMWRDGYH
jgi:hypothetical protein